jgi:hypothetical protein
MSLEAYCLWDRHHLTLVELDGGSTQFSVRRTHELDWPVDAFDGDINTLGIWLKQKKIELGYTTESITLVLPREQILVRLIDIPHVDPNDQFDLVKFQVATKLAVAVDQLTTDFYQLSNPDKSSTSASDDLYVVALRNTLRDRITRIFSLANWTISSAIPSFIGLAELSAHVNTTETKAQPVVAIWHHGTTIEWVFHRHGRVEVAQSLKKYDGTPEQLARAIFIDLRKAMVSAADLSEIARIDVIASYPGASSVLAHMIQEELKVPVNEVPCTTWASGLSTDQSQSALVPLIGARLAQKSPLIKAIDLINPRKPKPKVDNTRVKRLLAIGSAVIVVAGGYFSWNMYLLSLNDQLASLQQKKSKSQETIKEGKPIVEAHGFILAWERLQDDYLQRMMDLNQYSPGTQSLYLEDIGYTADDNRKVIRISGLGYAKERTDVDLFIDQLVVAGYRVRPRQIEKLAGTNEYPFKFNLDADLPDATVKATPAKSPAATSKTKSATTTSSPATNSTSKGQS